eukprot:3391512-Rhodomonas_salina.1
MEPSSPLSEALTRCALGDFLAGRRPRLRLVRVGPPFDLLRATLSDRLAQQPFDVGCRRLRRSRGDRWRREGMGLEKGRGGREGVRKESGGEREAEDGSQRRGGKFDGGRTDGG